MRASPASRARGWLAAGGGKAGDTSEPAGRARPGGGEAGGAAALLPLLSAPLLIARPGYAQRPKLGTWPAPDPARAERYKGRQRRPCSWYLLWLSRAADPPADCEQRGGAGGVDSGWSPEPGRGQGGAAIRFRALPWATGGEGSSSRRLDPCTEKAAEIKAREDRC